MRVVYHTPPSPSFDVCFSPNENVRGGGISNIKFFKPNYHDKRGGSFLGILSNIVSRAIPFIKRVIFPEAGAFAKNVMQDISNENVPLKKTLRKNIVKSIRNVGEKIIHGAGRVNKPKKIKKKNKKKKQKTDKKKKQKKG